MGQPAVAPGGFEGEGSMDQDAPSRPLPVPTWVLSSHLWGQQWQSWGRTPSRVPSCSLASLEDAPSGHSTPWPLPPATRAPPQSLEPSMAPSDHRMGLTYPGSWSLTRTPHLTPSPRSTGARASRDRSRKLSPSGVQPGAGSPTPPPPGTALLVGRTHLLRLGGSLRGQRSPLPGLWFPSQLEPPKTGGGSGGCWLLGRMAFEPVSRQPLPGLCLLPGHPVLGHPTDPPLPPGHTPPFRPRSGPSFRAISPHTGAGPVQFHPFPHQCCHRKGRMPGRRDFWVSTQYFLV